MEPLEAWLRMSLKRRYEAALTEPLSDELREIVLRTAHEARPTDRA